MTKLVLMASVLLLVAAVGGGALVLAEDRSLLGPIVLVALFVVSVGAGVTYRASR